MGEHESGVLPAQRLAAAKLALLDDAREARVQAAMAARDPNPSLELVKDAIRQKPLIFAGIASVLGFVLIRQSGVVKAVVPLLAARVGAAVLKRVMT